MAPRFREQGRLKRREVAQAHKVRPFLHRFGYFFVINARNNSC